jgi:hypothetical protein
MFKKALNGIVRPGYTEMSMNTLLRNNQTISVQLFFTYFFFQRVMNTVNSLKITEIHSKFMKFR